MSNPLVNCLKTQPVVESFLSMLPINTYMILFYMVRKDLRNEIVTCNRQVEKLLDRFEKNKVFPLARCGREFIYIPQNSLFYHCTGRLNINLETSLRSAGWVSTRMHVVVDYNDRDRELTEAIRHARRRENVFLVKCCYNSSTYRLDCKFWTDQGVVYYNSIDPIDLDRVFGINYSSIRRRNIFSISEFNSELERIKVIENDSHMARRLQERLDFELALEIRDQEQVQQSMIEQQS